MSSFSLIDLNEVEQAFDFVEGYSRPNWKLIGGALETKALDLDLDRAWTEVAIQWLRRLKDDIGGR